MSTTPCPHSDELNTRIGLSAVPSDGVVGSAWVPIGTSTGEKKPEPKQGELMERDLEQSHDLSAQEGTDAAPIEEPAAEEIASPQPEPDIPSKEHATPEVAGLSPEASLAGITVQQPMVPSKAEEPSGEGPEARSDLPEALPSELEALQELQRLGLTEVEGQPLKELLSLAQRRALALGRLAEARRNFADGMDKSDEALIKNAYENAQAALGMLQKIQYPEGETFAARRSALAGDLAQVRALLAAIDTWWWQRFAQALAEVYAHLKTPEQANASLTQAETLLEGWPDIEKSAKAKAQEALATARKEVEGLAERQFRALLDEAQVWLELANATTDSSGDEQADGALALEYVARAEAVHKAAERLKNEMKGGAKGRSTTALNDFTPNLKRAKQRALEKFPSAVLERRRRLIADQIAAWQRDYTQAAGTERQAWDYLFTATDERARNLRRRLDDLIDLIRLDPDYMPDEAIRDLIRRREENRRRSAELVAEAKRLWSYAASCGSGRQPDTEAYVYLVWCLLKEAGELDPDLDADEGEIKQLSSNVENSWRQLQSQIDSLFSEAETKQNNLDETLDKFGKQKHGSLDQDRLVSLREASEAVESDLRKLKDTLSKHLKTPAEWNMRMNLLEQRYDKQKVQVEDIVKTFRRVQEIVEAWKTPHDLPLLIAEAEAVCTADTLPAQMRHAAVTAVQEAVRQALPQVRRLYLPIPRQIELTWLIGRLNEEATRHEDAVANREAGS